MKQNFIVSHADIQNLTANPIKKEEGFDSRLLVLIILDME